MILVDSALARHVSEGRPPIRVGMVGAGFMAAGTLLQINTVHASAMRVVAIANRTPEKAVRAYAAAGQDDAAICDESPALARAIEAGRAAVTTDPMLVARSPHVDVLFEVTGAVEDALPIVLAAIEHGKHVVLMNAELDGTVGCSSRPRPTQPASSTPMSTATSQASSRTSGDSSKASASAPCSAATSRASRIPTAPRPHKPASPRNGARTRRWSHPSPTAPRSASNRPSSPTRPA